MSKQLNKIIDNSKLQKLIGGLNIEDKSFNSQISDLFIVSDYIKTFILGIAISLVIYLIIEINLEISWIVRIIYSVVGIILVLIDGIILGFLLSINHIFINLKKLIDLIVMKLKSILSSDNISYQNEIAKISSKELISFVVFTFFVPVITSGLKNIPIIGAKAENLISRLFNLILNKFNYKDLEIDFSNINAYSEKVHSKFIMSLAKARKRFNNILILLLVIISSSLLLLTLIVL